MNVLLDGVLGGGWVGVALGVQVHRTVADGPDVIETLNPQVTLGKDVAALVGR